MSKNNIVSLRELYNHDIRKVNAIATSAAFDFSLIEQKIVDYISTIITAPNIDQQGHITYQTTYKLNYIHFCQCTNTSPSTRFYKIIDDAIRSLSVKSIELILPNNGKTGIKVIDRYEIHEGKPYYTIIQLDDRMIPILIDKKKNFFKHHPEYTLFMNKKYSTRLYPWLTALLNKEIGKKCKYTRFNNTTFANIDIAKLQKEDKQKYLKMRERIYYSEYVFNISLKAIRYQLSISSNYRGYNTIKTKILDVVKKEIEEITDMVITSMSYDSDSDFVRFVVRKKNTIEIAITDSRNLEKINKNNTQNSEPSEVITDYQPGQIKDIEVIEKWIELA